MTNDFTERLLVFINALNCPVTCKLNVLETEESMSLQPMPNSRTIREYYDGIVDRVLVYAIAVKLKSNYKALTVLNSVAYELENVRDVPSDNESYTFTSIKVSQAPAMAGYDGKFMVYECQIEAEITTIKE